jgi:hypothetical protein
MRNNSASVVLCLGGAGRAEEPLLPRDVPGRVPGRYAAGGGLRAVRPSARASSSRAGYRYACWLTYVDECCVVMFQLYLLTAGCDWW